MPAFVGPSVKAVTCFNKDPRAFVRPTRAMDVARVEKECMMAVQKMDLVRTMI